MGDRNETVASAAACPAGGLGAIYQPFSEVDLYPTLARARAEEPVFYSPEIDYWVVTRYADVKRALNDPASLSAAIALDPVTPLAPEVVHLLKAGGFAGRSVLVANASASHRRVRGYARLGFTPKRIRSLEPHIRRLADQAIDAFAADGRADLVRQMVYELPAQVLFILLGIPDDDVQMIKHWADNRLLLTFGRLPVAEQLACARDLLAFWHYSVRHVARCLEDPEDDLPSDMIRARGGDDAVLTLDEIANTIFGLLLAGHETTTNLSANALMVLLQRRERWAALVANPSLIPAAVEEVLRFRSSVIAWRREALKPIEIAGVPIPAGARLLLMLASANHDDSRFIAPETFDLGRPNPQDHLSFGYGAHFCLGAPLGRFEVQIILEHLTKRLPSLRLVPDQDFDPVPTIAFRGPRRLLVEWD